MATQHAIGGSFDHGKSINISLPIFNALAKTEPSIATLGMLCSKPMEHNDFPPIGFVFSNRVKRARTDTCDAPARPGCAAKPGSVDEPKLPARPCVKSITQNDFRKIGFVFSNRVKRARTGTPCATLIENHGTARERTRGNRTVNMEC
ncbi:MAG TPA: hypothetical protein VGV35_00700 [Bryobacteraceae bacterium]|nr:hypothetical protein [Bryobacteraceae bacterium]